jgi:DNA-binding beta-propeller fold protein YncE
MRRLLLIAILAASLAGCGGAHPRAPTTHARPMVAAAGPRVRSAAGPQARSAGGSQARSPESAPLPHATGVGAGGHRRTGSQPRPHALVTDESQDLLAIVDLRSRTARLFIGVPGGPQYVAAEPGVALVTSTAAGAVTLLHGDPLRVVKVFHGFGAPHVIEISPDGQRAYVTDDARGTLTVIRLSDSRVTNRLLVGAHAHHMASSPDQRRLWIALGESARTVVMLDTSNVDNPRVIGRFDPGFPAHDLAFGPDGRRVWITSASGPDVMVFRASDHRPLFRVRVGPPPQHIAFAGASVYLTSGYGRAIEQVSASTGHVIRRARSPYGSFELDAADGFVTTASLLDGKLAIYTPQLKLLHVIKLGPATRDVEISNP